MKTAGIVTEYDPFHAGHAWQLAKLRQNGIKNIVVCMSGDLTQRGGMALLPPEVRAKAALLCGADLVLCLPNCYSSLSAEGFAAAGVRILSALPAVDYLAFGAETPDATSLMQIARVLNSAEFHGCVQAAPAGTLPFAALRAQIAKELCPGAAAVLASANNNLGVEYCKAIANQNSRLVPLPLPRKGAAHGQATPGQQGFASASFLRAQWHTDGCGAIKQWVPAKAFELYKQAAACGQDADEKAFGVALLSRLRAMSASEIAATRGTTEGLEHLLAGAVRTAPDLPHLYSAMKSKRYAHARLRRYVLAAALGYTAALPQLPPYVHVLAANERGLGLLKGAALPADTSLANLAKKSEGAGVVAAAHAAGADLAALCRKTPGPMGQSYTQKPYLPNF